jgi:polysaccharide export outer membrane protein
MREFQPMRPNLLLLLCLPLLAGLAGCETTQGTGEAGSNPRLPEGASAAHLRPGDSLVVALQGIPDATNLAVQVDDQGEITLPYIGGLVAAGLTPAGFSRRIRETYIARDFYRTIDVSVTVTERYIYVGGEVQRPGRVVWTPDLTLTKAIQSAGGFTLYARETSVSVVRDQNAFQLDARLAQRQPAEDPRLMPGDSVQVARSAF